MFSKAVSGVIDQGGPSRFEESCLYRGPNGRKCGIGHLIEDKDYLKEMDDHTVNGGCDVSNLYEREVLPSYLGSNLEFLVSLQCLHDGLELDSDLPLFIERCKRYAKNNDLKMPT
jgi:hypothetical protein